MAGSNEVIKTKTSEVPVKKIVLVIGQTGPGKSTLINMLLNNDTAKSACESPCSVETSVNPVTDYKWLINPVTGNLFGDPVGLSEPQPSDEKICIMIKEFINMIKGGVYCIIIIARSGQFTKEAMANCMAIKKVFYSQWKQAVVGELNEHSQKEAIRMWAG